MHLQIKDLEEFSLILRALEYTINGLELIEMSKVCDNQKSIEAYTEELKELKTLENKLNEKLKGVLND